MEIDSGKGHVITGYVLEDPNRIFRFKDPKHFMILSFKLSFQNLDRDEQKKYMKAVVETGITVALNGYCQRLFSILTRQKKERIVPISYLLFQSNKETNLLFISLL